MGVFRGCRVQCRLDHSVGDEVDAWGEGDWVADGAALAGQSRAVQRVDQRRYLAKPRLGAERTGVIVLAQHAQQAAQVAEGLAAGLLDGENRVARLFGIGA